MRSINFFSETDLRKETKGLGNLIKDFLEGWTTTPYQLPNDQEGMKYLAHFVPSAAVTTLLNRLRTQFKSELTTLKVLEEALVKKNTKLYQQIGSIIQQMRDEYNKKTTDKTKLDEYFYEAIPKDEIILTKQKDYMSLIKVTQEEIQKLEPMRALITDIESSLYTHNYLPLATLLKICINYFYQIIRTVHRGEFNSEDKLIIISTLCDYRYQYETGDNDDDNAHPVLSGNLKLKVELDMLSTFLRASFREARVLEPIHSHREHLTLAER